MRSLLIIGGLAAALARADPLPVGQTSELQVAPEEELPGVGPRYALVTLDLYLALPISPWAARAVPRIERAAKRPDVRVRFHLTGGAASSTLEQAEALCEAREQERFVELLEQAALQAQGPGGRPLDRPAELARAAAAAGMVPGRLAEALADHRHRARAIALLGAARADGHGGNELTVNGAPAPLEIGDRELESRIGGERERALRLRERGVSWEELDQALRAELAGGNDPLAPGPHRRAVIPVDGAPARGPEVAPVTIVHFGGLTHGQSARIAEVIRRCELRWPGRIRVVWKHLPGFGPGEQAAEWGAAAAAQGNFWGFHDAALKSASYRFRLEPSELQSWMVAARLDPQRAAREVGYGMYRAQVERDKADARRLGLGSAPMVAVNGLLVDGGRAEAIEKLVERELELGLLERLQPK